MANYPSCRDDNGLVSTTAEIGCAIPLLKAHGSAASGRTNPLRGERDPNSKSLTHFAAILNTKRGN
jgi:hypothetical protein